MDDKLHKILTKIYWKGYPDNYTCNASKDYVWEFSTNNLSDNEKLYLKNSKWEVNNIIHFTHDSAIKKVSLGDATS